MQENQIFISHASADDAFVAKLRKKLEAYRLPVWVDSRNLRGGDKLAAEITQAIEVARHFIVVLSFETVNSPWVRAEIEQALIVETRRHADGYRVIPLLLPGITPGALGTWFKKEPVAVSVQPDAGGLTAAWPAILTALGERLPSDSSPAEQPVPRPIEELVLLLTDPKIEFDSATDTRHLTATATLVYEPAHPSARSVESRRFVITAPLSPLEVSDISWYLEQYCLWPVGVFKKRAEGLEQKLPQWGQMLYKAALGSSAAGEALTAWQHAADCAERRFSVQVDSQLPDGASAQAEVVTREAATEWLALPWELLHDGHGWLFQGRHSVRVRRKLPKRQPRVVRSNSLPIRILLVSPRPEQNEYGAPVSYIDHRMSARPLVETVENLGELVHLALLTPPTFASLDQALQDAAKRDEPFDVVHFDGHGVYNRSIGQGGLCFENPNDADKLEQRTMEFITANKLGGLFRQHRIPLVILEACQTAKAETDPTASVAVRLLEEGVISVVAMSHSVLVETSRRFVQAFYRELARGTRVGQAMLAGQRALFADSRRGKVMGAGELHLQDWFVPVIYQEKQDPQIVKQIPTQDVQHIEAKNRQRSLGALPDEPPHKFHGRSRDLLALERLLHSQPWAVVRGTGGAGKTTLATELARWLTRTGRFERAAFVSLERHRDAHAVLDSLGHQLLTQGNKYSVAQYRDLDQALLPVERALRDHPTIFVLDNCESVLPSLDSLDEGFSTIVSLAQRLISADSRTRLLFTTRELLPSPLDHPGRVRELGALDRRDAVELVSQVMQQYGWTPPLNDSGRTPNEITDLVEAVHGHARALVRLAPEVARSGVRATTANLSAIMADLDRKHPGDRENSLYASVELSLRRLSPVSRQHIQALAVCQDGVHLSILGTLTDLEKEEKVSQLVRELTDVGLCEALGHGHLRLDPGLPSYLLRELTADEVESLRSRWVEAMAALTILISKQSTQHAEVTAQLSLLELPNFLAMLNWAEVRWTPDRFIDLASRVEKLVAPLGQPHSMGRVTRMREQAGYKLCGPGSWSHGRFLSESAHIERLLERRELPAARVAIHEMLSLCLAAGESAYAEAAYDIAVAHFLNARALRKSSDIETALSMLSEAQRRFQALAEMGSAVAERMASVTIMTLGDCLTELGRLDEAADAIEAAIARHGAKNHQRDVAIGKLQLGTLRMRQRRYPDALKMFIEARDTSMMLGEPGSVANAWHQIGMAHHKAGQFEHADQALRQSLAIKVRENDRSGQASTLNQLGNLYDEMGRLEDAKAFYEQCAEISVQFQDLAQEGKARSNLGGTLIKLQRYDEARHELLRALVCKKPFGDAAAPWNTWATLANLEGINGAAEAAMEARQHAIRSYMAYRRAGGVSLSSAARLFALINQALQNVRLSEARQILDSLAIRQDATTGQRTLISKLQALLNGDFDPSIGDHLDLDYGDSAELQLLLEIRSSTTPAGYEGTTAACTLH